MNSHEGQPAARVLSKGISMKCTTGSRRSRPKAFSVVLGMAPAKRLPLALPPRFHWRAVCRRCIPWQGDFHAAGVRIGAWRKHRPCLTATPAEMAKVEGGFPNSFCDLMAGRRSQRQGFYQAIQCEGWGMSAETGHRYCVWKIPANAADNPAGKAALRVTLLD